MEQIAALRAEWFVRLAEARMRRLVAQRLEGRAGTSTPETVPVRPAHADPRAEERLDR